MDVTYKGMTRSHKDWARFCGVSEQTMRWRLAHWDIERAVTSRKVEDVRTRRAPRYQSVNLTTAEKVVIVQAYIDGASEDDIASLVGISRRTVSEILIAMNIKNKGTAPSRVVASSRVIAASVRARGRRVIIKIEAA